MATPSETFPSLSASDAETRGGGGNGGGLGSGSGLGFDATSGGTLRARRKSSGLGGEIRAGDTGVPAMATLDSRPPSPYGALPRSPPPSEKDRRRSGFKRRKAKTFLQQCKRTAIKHTWTIPLVLLALILSLYAVNPRPSNPVHSLIFLSYRMPLPADALPGTPPQYGKGPRDVGFMVFYIIVLSFTREFVMQRLLRPLARRSGLKSRAKQSRFMEQAYTALYFGLLGPCGLYVMSRTPVWYFNTTGMYLDFPHRTHEAAIKFYYLFQAAYWAQQAIVLLLGMEKPRKDFRELVGHHIVTLFLIGLSYRFHFTYIGLAVYITHDISDFFLATSKVMNYLDHPWVGPYFGFFIGTWLYLRHYLNFKIILSLFGEFQTIGPYTLDWRNEQYKCPLAFYITLTLLASLQALNLFWLFYILRIAYRFAFLNIAEDDRSDNDENEFKEEQKADAARRAKAMLAAAAAEAKSADDDALPSTPSLPAPQVLLNGGPVDHGAGEAGEAGEASGVDVVHAANGSAQGRKKTTASARAS